MPGGGSGGQSTTTQVNYPPEYKGLMEAAAAKAQEVSALPFSQYTDDRVANLSPDTLAAFNLARGAIGSTDAINDASLGALGNFGNYSGLETGAAALDAYGRPDLYSNMDYASPLVGNALPALNQSSAAYTQNILDSTGANSKIYDVIGNYMNPYTESVLGQLAAAGGRNLQENIIPGINSTFVGGGAFGGSRNNEFMSRAVRDTQDSILGKQLEALNSQFNNAASQAQSDLSRLTGTATTLGGQYGQDLSRTIEGTETLSNILTNAGTSDADRRTAAAKYLESLGATDAASQLTYGQNLQDFGTNIYNQNLKDASILEGIGQTQQQQEQNEIDAQMAAFNEAQNYPEEQLNTLIKPLQSFSVTPNTTQTTSGGGSSAFGDVLGGIIGAASLFKRGGRVGYAEGGRMEDELDRYMSSMSVDDIARTLSNSPAGRHLPANVRSADAGIDLRSPLATRGRRMQGGSPLTATPQSNLPSEQEIQRLIREREAAMRLDDVAASQEFYRNNPDMRMRARGGSVGYADHTRSTLDAIQGYADGGSVLDDLLRKIFAQEQAVQGPQMPETSSPFTTPGFQGFPDAMRSSFQKRMAELPPMEPDRTDAERYAEDPITNAPPTRPQSPLVAARPQHPTQGTRPIASQGSPLVENGIRWNGPRMVQEETVGKAMNPNGTPYGQSQPDTLQQKIQALLDKQHDDRWRSALLQTGVNMIGGEGGFTSQLGRGLRAGASDLDKSKSAYSKGLLDVAGLERKGTNDLLDYIVAQDRLKKTPGVENKEDSARARAAQDFINNDPSMLSKSPEEKLAIYDKMVSGKTVVPQSNIKNKLGAPEVGQVVMGRKFKGGNPRDPNNWE